MVQVKAEIWPWLADVCQVRSTAAHTGINQSINPERAREMRERARDRERERERERGALLREYS